MTIQLLQFVPDDNDPKNVVPQRTHLNVPPSLASFCLANNAWPEVLFLDGTFYGLTTWSGKESAEYEKTLGFDLNVCKQKDSDIDDYPDPVELPEQATEPKQSGETPA